MDITFSWKNKQYTVKESILKKRYIVLPNRSVIEPMTWIIGPPHKMWSAQEIDHPLEHARPGEIAEHFGDAVLATEVED